MDAYNRDNEIATILRRARVIAVVGASPRETRPSNMVSRYLMGQGYTVIPVRPKVREILGSTCYTRLEDVPVKVDIVNVFRRPEACVDIAWSAVSIGAGTLWLQEGIVCDEAKRIAEQGGLQVVMGNCIRVAHEKLVREVN